MTNPLNEILVQKYLGGELSKQERNQFEEKLKSNSELQEELEFQKDLTQKMSDKRLLNFKSRIDRIHQEITGERKVYRLFSNKALSLIAASIIVLLSIGGVVLSKYNTHQSTDEIFLSYYDTYEMSVAKRSTIDSSSKLVNANNLYTNGAYDQAIIILLEIKEQETEIDSNVEMMLGISNMELGKYEMANLSFKRIIETENPFFTQQATWYQGLCLLKLNLVDEAILQFSAIQNDQGFYKDNATEILELLN